MVDMETFRKWALGMPGTEEQPHFDKPSFRANNKIFATLWEKENRAMLRLPLVEQSVFCSYGNGEVFFPVPGGWGRQGATFVDLTKVRKTMLKDAMRVSYQSVTEGKKK